MTPADTVLIKGRQVALVPGDLIAYAGTGFFAWVIRTKTWSSCTHVEVYAGHGRSWASRDGQGVGLYPVRLSEVCTVRRPRLGDVPLDTNAMHDFADRCKGQRYDWLGLLRFYTLGKQSDDKQFCSEYATRLYRAGGFEPFYKDTDADLVSPGMFLTVGAFTAVYSA